jgi:hypothetical protein
MGTSIVEMTDHCRRAVARRRAGFQLFTQPMKGAFLPLCAGVE